MTSLQRSLSAIGGSDFAAVPMISLRPSRSIEDSHDLVAAMARSNYVAAGDATSPRESLSVTAAEKITTIYFEQHWSLDSHATAARRAAAPLRPAPRGLPALGWLPPVGPDPVHRAQNTAKIVCSADCLIAWARRRPTQHHLWLSTGIPPALVLGHSITDPESLIIASRLMHRCSQHHRSRIADHCIADPCIAAHCIAAHSITDPESLIIASLLIALLLTASPIQNR